MMCKRQIINAGISQVIVRDTKEDYRIINVSDWIEDDDSLSGKFGY
jgi:dCMP deaminase